MSRSNCYGDLLSHDHLKEMMDLLKDNYLRHSEVHQVVRMLLDYMTKARQYIASHQETPPDRYEEDTRQMAVKFASIKKVVH